MNETNLTAKDGATHNKDNLSRSNSPNRQDIDLIPINNFRTHQNTIYPAYLPQRVHQLEKTVEVMSRVVSSRILTTQFHRGSINHPLVNNLPLRTQPSSRIVVSPRSVYRPSYLPLLRYLPLLHVSSVLQSHASRKCRTLQGHERCDLWRKDARDGGKRFRRCFGWQSNRDEIIIVEVTRTLHWVVANPCAWFQGIAIGGIAMKPMHDPSPKWAPRLQFLLLLPGPAHFDEFHPLCPFPLFPVFPYSCTWSHALLASLHLWDASFLGLLRTSLGEGGIDSLASDDFVIQSTFLVRFLGFRVHYSTETY